MSMLPNKKEIDNSYILSFFFRTYMKFKYLWTSDKKYAEKLFLRKFHKELDLENPKTFNEKIQWLKLNDRKEIHTICADKIAVRDFVSGVIGEKYLIPLEHVFISAKDLKPENFANDYPIIIKCNHNSGAYTIVRDKNNIDWKKERLKYSNLLKQNYYHQGREWQYKNIEPKILVEKLLFDSKGNIPNDYKIFCFEGEAKFIQVDIDRQINHLRNFYDTSWNLLPIELIYNKGDDVVKPKKIDLMLELAGKLSKNFPFARVDFYSLDDDIYFGEITFHPEAGFGVFNDEKYDVSLGNYLSLDKLK
ncbi:MAG: glycosyl transferase [Flavobacteriaceae bacterium]|nr:MAG: glycosyl transferase [Flavobacteriaceae bacterium]